MVSAAHDLNRKVAGLATDPLHRFPPVLRRVVQATLMTTWNMSLPFFQILSPARVVAQLLIRELGSSLSQYTFVDFCAGAGGPTPSIEREVNGHLRSKNEEPVDFVLTDIHPNVASWEKFAKKNDHITYVPEPVDASKAPPSLVQRSDGKKLLRIFNLAFHHFDDKLATDIFRDAVRTNQAFAIFELQDRSFNSFVATSLLPFGVILAAPFYALKWRSPATFIFTWIIPIIPPVLVFDGWVSSLRTREPDELEALFRNSGVDTSNWEMTSGREMHLWPIGYVNWTFCKPKEA